MALDLPPISLTLAPIMVVSGCLESEQPNQLFVSISIYDVFHRNIEQQYVQDWRLLPSCSEFC